MAGQSIAAHHITYWLTSTPENGAPLISIADAQSEGCGWGCFVSFGEFRNGLRLMLVEVERVVKLGLFHEKHS